MQKRPADDGKRLHNACLRAFSHVRPHKIERVASRRSEPSRSTWSVNTPVGRICRRRPPAKRPFKNFTRHRRTHYTVLCQNLLTLRCPHARRYFYRLSEPRGAFRPSDSHGVSQGKLRKTRA